MKQLEKIISKYEIMEKFMKVSAKDEKFEGQEGDFGILGSIDSYSQ